MLCKLWPTTTGTVSGMSKDKATITVDREQVAEVQRLTGAATTSAAIDLALRELIRTARLRSDIAAYASTPAAEDEIALARTTPSWADLQDETDWDAEFPET